jgi:hypothetical protein
MERPTEIVGTLADLGGLIFQAMNYAVAEDQDRLKVVVAQAARILDEVQASVCQPAAQLMRIAG